MVAVDIHSHVLLPQTFGKAGEYGPFVYVDGEDIVVQVGEHQSRVKLDADGLAIAQREPARALEQLTGGPESRISRMDQTGIDIMGVTISPLFYLYWASAEIAAEFARVQNDALAEYCGAFPDRLFFMPTLPLQDIAAAVAEIDRAVGQMGGRGINIGGSNIAGRDLDDPALRPVYAKAVEYDVPLFIHPYPEPLAGDGRDDYNLSWILGYLNQESVAFTRLILGGVLDDFPELKVCVTHGGGVVPYQLGRIERFAEHVPGVRAKRPVAAYLQNFYFDALVHDRRARRLLIDVIGVDNVIWGSNFGSPQDRADLSFLDDVGLSEEERSRIAGGNAVRLFKLDALNRPRLHNSGHRP